MIRYIILTTILVLSVAAVTLTFRSDDSDRAENDPTELQDLWELVNALETSLDEERTYRVQLERRLDELVSQNSRLTEQAISQPSEPDTFEQSPQQQDERVPIDAGVEQIQRLVEEGIDERDATEIVRLSEEYEMQWLQARYQARQSGQPANGNLRAELAQRFRENLGEENYEKYLRSVGQTTSVVIRNVLESSPAQSAGLQSGDEIISYDGRRVYNILELNQLTQLSSETGSVRVELIRNGLPVTVILPQGPIGITASVRAGEQ